MDFRNNVIWIHICDRVETHPRSPIKMYNTFKLYIGINKCMFWQPEQIAAKEM